MPRCGCHGKPGEVIVRALVAEVVEQQERIEFVGFAEAEAAMQFHAGAFHGGRGFDDASSQAEGTWQNSESIGLPSDVECV